LLACRQVPSGNDELDRRPLLLRPIQFHCILGREKQKRPVVRRQEIGQVESLPRPSPRMRISLFASALSASSPVLLLRDSSL
jgi:hypothetical protein